MPAGVPDPEAVLRGHRGEVQALDFDSAERWLVSGDSLGEVRVWDLADLRPAAIRRLHPLSGGILSLRLFHSAGRQLLGTQGRDGATLLWECNTDDLQLSEEPVRSFVRDCYSFCRFDVLAAEPPPACGEREPPGGGAWHQQQDCQQQKAEEFVAAVLADELQPAAPTSGAEGQPAAGAAAEEGSGRSADGTGGVSSAPECGTAVGAAIWALHPCSQASLEQPPALLAIPGADERTAEVACATCGQRVAEFQEQAAGRKLGMLMAVQLYCCGGAPQAAATPPATSATDGQPAAQSADAAAEDRQGAMGSVSAEPAHVSPSWAAHPAAPLPTLPRICLAAGYEDGSVAIWEVGAARGVPPLALRQLCSEPVMALAVDGSGAGGACGSAEEQVVVFKIDHAARRLSVRHTIELRGKGKAGVGDVAVRPDRRLLATAGWDGRVRLYKYRSGRPLAVLKYHSSSPVTGLRFAPRSMLLASAARDGTLALWNLYTPEEAG